MWAWPVPKGLRVRKVNAATQELVFIGRNFDEANLRRRLEQALLTDAEFQDLQDLEAREEMMQAFSQG